MASKTITAAPRFAEGATLNVWPSVNVTGSGASGVSVASAVVTGGQATFSGLTAGARYAASTSASGPFITFSADESAAAGGSGVPPGGTAGQALTKLSGADGDADWQPPDVTQSELDAVNAKFVNTVSGALYTGTAPARPAGGSFVLWNGNIDPGAAAVDGDLGIGWS